MKESKNTNKKFTKARYLKKVDEVGQKVDNIKEEKKRKYATNGKLTESDGF